MLHPSELSMISKSHPSPPCHWITTSRPTISLPTSSFSLYFRHDTMIQCRPRLLKKSELGLFGLHISIDYLDKSKILTPLTSCNLHQKVITDQWTCKDMVLFTTKGDTSFELEGKV